MDEADRRHLRTIIAVTITMAGRKLLLQAAEKPSGLSEPARQELAELIAADIEQQFSVERKPYVVPPPIHY